MLLPTIAFLGASGGELVVVLLAFILLFGPKDAPRMLRRWLSFLHNARQSANHFRDQILYADVRVEPAKPSEPKTPEACYLNPELPDAIQTAEPAKSTHEASPPDSV